jgi:hypothetical protein
MTASAEELAYCDTCGALPCTNPSFCAACEQADRERVARERTVLSGYVARQLQILATRSAELAEQVAGGLMAKVDAVDIAYDAATASGLVSAVGDDVIQEILAAAFGPMGSAPK